MKKFMEYLPDHFGGFAELQALGECADSEAVSAETALQGVWTDLFLDSMETTVTSRWERILNIHHEGLPLSERRAEVIARLNTRAPITVRKLQQILAQMTGCTVEIQVQPENFHFIATVYRKDAEIDIPRLLAYIGKAKPANMTCQVVVINGFVTAVGYVGGALMVGDIVTIRQRD